MTRRLILMTPLALCLAATVACPKKVEPPVEELPAEIAATLQPLPGTDILVGTPPRTAPPSDLFTGPLPAPRACLTTQEFFSYILYPITFCSPTFGFGDVLTTYQEAITPPNVVPPGGAQTRTYRLLTFLGQPRTPAWTCHQRSGPWGATISKTMFCNGATSCAMAIPCPGCPVFLWSGDNCETEGRPPEVTFIPELHPRPESSVRCPGSLSQCGDEPPPPPPPPV